MSTDSESPPRARLSNTGRVMRTLSFAALGGVVWSIYMGSTAEEMGPLVYLFMYLPIFSGISISLFVASHFLVDSRSTPAALADRRSSHFSRFVTVLISIGVIALLGEAVAIFQEGKVAQAFELGGLSAALVVFRVCVHRLKSHTRLNVDVATLLALVLLGAFWWPVLNVILSIFDRA